MKELFRAKLTKKVFVLPVGIWVFLSIPSLLTFFSFISNLGELKIVLLAPTAILFAILVLPVYMRYNATSLIIYDKKIKGETGVFKLEILDSPLEQVSSVVVKFGILGSIFDYGTIIVGTSSTAFKFKYIDNPDVAQKIILEQIETCKNDRLREQAEILAKAIKN